MSHQVHVILTTFCLSVQDRWDFFFLGGGGVVGGISEKRHVPPFLLILHGGYRTEIDNALLWHPTNIWTFRRSWYVVDPLPAEGARGKLAFMPRILIHFLHTSRTEHSLLLHAQVTKLRNSEKAKKIFLSHLPLII